jgi:hypothetical protein
VAAPRGSGWLEGSAPTTREVVHPGPGGFISVVDRSSSGDNQECLILS